jgi:ribonuclease P protein component
VLAKANRVVSAEDYRGTVRRGRRITSTTLVAYVRRHGGAGPARFGFIVSKSVGNAVMRNLVRRRLKAASYAVLPQVAPGTDIVVRALPGAAQASWANLRQELDAALGQAGPATDRMEARRG